MVASEVQFSDSPALIAALPSLLPCDVEDLLCGYVLWAVIRMAVAFTDGSGFCRADGTSSVLTSDVCRWDERRAPRLGAVRPIGSLEFDSLL